MKRINAITQLINNKNIVVDVGSDHAYLAINLLKNNKCNKVINVEIATEPLALTINNLSKNNLLDKTINILNDGLKNISTLISDINIDMLTISGLGASSMVEILSKRDQLLQINEVILVPNNNHHLIREWSLKNKYEIVFEQVIRQDEFYYFLIHLKQKPNLVIDYSDVEIAFGRFNITSKTKEFSMYLSQLRDMIESKKLNYKNNKFKILLEQIKQIQE